MLTDAQKNALLTCVDCEVQQATTYLASSLLADAQAELATARATNSRLNRRLQIAESALNEANGTGRGAPNKIQREAWTSYQEQLRETRVKLNKIGALAEAWEHTDHDADEREPDCAGCWSASIWAILGDES